MFTSVQQGLDPDSSGYCTVRKTPGIGRSLQQQLEKFSSYRPQFPPHTPQEWQNPINFAHRILVDNRQRWHVLSRIAYSGLEYSGRNNHFAHHVLLKPEELPVQGPAWLIGREDFMESEWDGEIGCQPWKRTLPQGDSQAEPDVCKLWGDLMGHPGWAGKLIEAFLEPTEQSCYVVYSLQTDVLTAFREAINLLPESVRWDVTFCTYFTAGSPGDIRWRGVLENTPEASKAIAVTGSDRLFDLRQHSLHDLRPSLWTTAAEAGEIPLRALEPAAREATAAEVKVPRRVVVPRRAAATTDDDFYSTVMPEMEEESGATSPSSFPTAVPPPPPPLPHPANRHHAWPYVMLGATSLAVCLLAVGLLLSRSSTSDSDNEPTIEPTQRTQQETTEGTVYKKLPPKDPETPLNPPDPPKLEVPSLQHIAVKSTRPEHEWYLEGQTAQPLARLDRAWNVEEILVPVSSASKITSPVKIIEPADKQSADCIYSISFDNMVPYRLIPDKDDEHIWRIQADRKLLENKAEHLRQLEWCAVRFHDHRILRLTVELQPQDWYEKYQEGGAKRTLILRMSNPPDTEHVRLRQVMTSVTNLGTAEIQNDEGALKSTSESAPLLLDSGIIRINNDISKFKLSRSTEWQLEIDGAVAKTLTGVTLEYLAAGTNDSSSPRYWLTLGTWQKKPDQETDDSPASSPIADRPEMALMVKAPESSPELKVEYLPAKYALGEFQLFEGYELLQPVWGASQDFTLSINPETLEAEIGRQSIHVAALERRPDRKWHLKFEKQRLKSDSHERDLRWCAILSGAHLLRLTTVLPIQELPATFESAQSGMWKLGLPHKPQSKVRLNSVELSSSDSNYILIARSQSASDNQSGDQGQFEWKSRDSNVFESSPATYQLLDSDDKAPGYDLKLNLSDGSGLALFPGTVVKAVKLNYCLKNGKDEHEFWIPLGEWVLKSGDSK